MTREDFIEIISGFENEGFKILSNDRWSDELKFVSTLSDSVKVISNGKPRMYKYSTIDELTFDLEAADAQAQPASVNTSTAQPMAVLEKINEVYWKREVDNAGRIVRMTGLTLKERRDDIKENVRGSLLQAEWNKVDSKFRDAVKQHSLNDKADQIIKEINKLYDKYPCVELKQQLAAVYAAMHDYAKAAEEFKEGGDYYNTAVCVLNQGDEQEALSLLAKHIVSGDTPDKDTLSVFLSLASKYNEGALCSYAMGKRGIENIPAALIDELYYGLVMVLYSVSGMDGFSRLNSNESRGRQVSAIMEEITRLTAGEKADKFTFPKLHHASEYQAYIELHQPPAGNNKQQKKPSQSNSTASAYIREGRNYLAEHRQDKAEQSFKNAMKYNPDSKQLSECVSNLLNICLQDNRTDEARKILERHKKLFGTEKYYSQLITILDKNTSSDIDKEESYKELISVLEERIPREKRNGARADRINKLMMAYINTGNAEKAIKGIENYQNSIDRQKYNDLYIKVMELTDQFDTLVEFLKRIIEKENKEEIKKYRINKLVSVYNSHKEYDKALECVEAYKNNLDEQTYNDLYLSFLNSSGQYDEQIEFLENILKSEYKTDTRMNYMYKLASLYRKQTIYDKSIYWFSEWKKTADAERSLLSASAAGAKLLKYEDTIDQNLSIVYFLNGDEETAKEYARNLLKKNSANAIAQQILDGTYNKSGEKENIDKSNEANAFDDYQSTQYKIPEIVEYWIEKMDYNTQLSNRKSILKNIRDNMYIASAEQASQDIQSYAGTMDNMSLDWRSDAWLAFAKIIKQFIDADKRDSFMTTEKLNEYIGRSLSLKGDSNIQKQDLNIDTSRYYYILAMGMLRSGHERYISSFNMFYNTFFLSENELSELLIKDTKRRDTNTKKSISYAVPEYDDALVSVKDLVLSTFNLYNANHETEVIRGIYKNIYKDEKLKEDVKREFDVILGIEGADIKDSSEFFSRWNKAYDVYNKKIEELNECLRKAASETHMAERVETYYNTLRDVLNKNILSRTDEERLSGIGDLLSRLIRLSGLELFDDRREQYERINKDCDRLFAEITEKPTMLSYEDWRQPVAELRDAARSMLNKMYKEYAPKLEVSTDHIAYCEKDYDKSLVRVYIENIGNVQTADITNVKLTGYDNNVELVGNPKASISAVRGNQKGEYVTEVKFTDKERKNKSFNISFSFDYNYYTAMDEPKEEHYEEVFQINLVDKDEFKKIDPNPFIKYSNSGAVKDDNLFKGRDKDIKDIVDMLDIGKGEVLSNRGIYMYGQKRAGKSSIMAHLEEQIQNKYPDKYLFVTMGSIGNIALNEKYEANFKSRIVRKIIDALRNTMPDAYSELDKQIGFKEAKSEISHNPESGEFEEILDTVSNYTGRTLMIFVDEFTYIYQGINDKLINPTFPHFWKAMLQNHNVCSIIIGQDNMKEFANDPRYMNDFACMSSYPVTYLNKEGAKSLMSDPIRNENGESRYEEDALNYIYELTAGSAYLIMVFCRHLVDYMNETYTSKVTRVTVNTFVREKLFRIPEFDPKEWFEPQINDPGAVGDEEAEKLRHDNTAILTYIANNCNQNHQIKIKDIDCTDMLSEKTCEYQDKIIEKLISRNVLIRDEDDCKICIDLLRIYLGKGR